MSSRHRLHFDQPPLLLRCGTRIAVNAPANWPALREEARTAFERGRRKGREEAAERLREAHAALAAAGRGAQQAIEQRFGELEPQVVDLVLEIAEGVICREVEEGRYDLQAIVRESLRGLRGLERDLEIRLHPRDFTTLNEAGISGGEGLRYATDPEVPPASCHVITSYGMIVRESGELIAQIRNLFREIALSSGLEQSPGGEGQQR